MKLLFVGVAATYIGILFVFAGIDKMRVDQGKEPLFESGYMSVKLSTGTVRGCFLYGGLTLAMGIGSLWSYYHG